MERRRESKDQSAEERNQKGESERLYADRNWGDVGNCHWWNERHEKVEAPKGKHLSQRTAQQREQQALCDDLASQAPSTGSQDSSNCNLPASHCGASQ